MATPINRDEVRHRLDASATFVETLPELYYKEGIGDWTSAGQPTGTTPEVTR